jgi:hypothetical protein
MIHTVVERELEVFEELMRHQYLFEEEDEDELSNSEDESIATTKQHGWIDVENKVPKMLKVQNVLISIRREKSVLARLKYFWRKTNKSRNRWIRLSVFFIFDVLICLFILRILNENYAKTISN